MVKTLITDFFIYRWRYWIGYGSIAAILIGLLLYAGLYVPGGISQQEMQTAVQTSSIDLQDTTSLDVTSLPYSLLQRAIFEIAGISNFTIKLPSLLFAFAASAGAVLLLRRWFKPNIAVLATIIMITTGQFVFVAQSGTPSITYITWSVWLLLAATMITSDAPRRIMWLYIFFTIGALSLYTPLSLYLLVAMMFAALLHPHVRHIIKRIPRVHLVGAATLGAVIIAPLGYIVSVNPELGLQLLGVANSWPASIIANIQQLIQQYLNFASPASGALMMPVFGLGSFILILIGVWQLFITRYTARSYTIVAWTIFLSPVLILNPDYTSVTFVPILLLLATGLEYLLSSWYRIFPRNPYARVAGLVPLVILVGGLVASGVERYVYGYHYDPQTATAFSRDLSLLQHDDVSKGSAPATLVVTKDEEPFYAAVAAMQDNSLTVTTGMPTENTFVATRAANQQINNPDISRIIVDSRSNAADRFYVYTPGPTE